MPRKYTKMTEEEKAERRRKRNEEWCNKVTIITYIPDGNGGKIELSRRENGVWYDNPEVSPEAREAQATKMKLVMYNAVAKDYGLEVIPASEGRGVPLEDFLTGADVP